MSCDPKPKLVKGESKTITCRVVDSSDNNFNLTGATISVKLPKQDSSILSVSGTITDALSGLFSFALTTANTALLRADPNYDFEAEIVIAGSTYIAQFEDLLNIVERVT